ncbi:MAG TPA: fibronectin type III domain-containing protein [Methanomassiliicoccales archaeon]|nr:fibronectin type III domain-containing protein [Methanomassiliicoccales archaeon]
MKRYLLSIIMIVLAVSVIIPTSSIGAEDGPLTAPTDLELVAGRDFVDLSWKAPVFNGDGNLTNYSIYRGFAPDDMQHLGNVTVNITAFHDGGVSAGDTCYYYVTAWNETAESAPSNAVVVTIIAQEKVEDGTLLGVIALAIAAVSIQLSIVAIWVMVRKAGSK